MPKRHLFGAILASIFLGIEVAFLFAWAKFLPDELYQNIPWFTLALGLTLNALVNFLSLVTLLSRAEAGSQAIALSSLVAFCEYLLVYFPVMFLDPNSLEDVSLLLAVFDLSFIVLIFINCIRRNCSIEKCLMLGILCSQILLLAEADFLMPHGFGRIAWCSVLVTELSVSVHAVLMLRLQKSRTGHIIAILWFLRYLLS